MPAAEWPGPEPECGLSLFWGDPLFTPTGFQQRQELYWKLFISLIRGNLKFVVFCSIIVLNGSGLVRILPSSLILWSFREDVYKDLDPCRLCCPPNLNTSARKDILPTFRWENQDSEKPNNLTKIVQILSTKIQGEPVFLLISEKVQPFIMKLIYGLAEGQRTFFSW